MLKPKTFHLPEHYPSETQAVLYWFEEISKIPRPSKREAHLKNWLKLFAQERRLPVKEDRAGNLLISKVGTAGFENCTPVVLQGHLDMVCEKNPSSTHDFLCDPIKLKYQSGWVKAEETSLGADNGIAIAYMLCLLDSNTYSHPPLECLMTIDEETGLTGALGLEKDFVRGKTLINIDSEEMGVFIVGCAGGKTSQIRFPINRVALTDTSSYSHFSLKVSGLSGGHSGIDIHRGKGNAIKILLRLLSQMSESFSLKILDVNGGTAHNAIPREASANIAFDARHIDDFKNQCAKWQKIFKNEFFSTDPHLGISFTQNQTPPQQPDALSDDSQRLLIDFGLAIAHGATYYSVGLPHLVETSINFALMRTDVDHLFVLSSQRSNLRSRLEELSSQVSALVKIAGGTIKTTDGYPPWEPQFDTPFLKLCTETYVEIFGQAAKIEVIHAGLETGVISEKYPDIAMISLGPTIKGAHSPDEQLCVEDISGIWKLLTALLRKLKH